MLGLLTLVQLHFTVSSGTSTSEFSILPNSSTPCPMRPCYTLSQVMDNPSNYFTSNTTVVFPPGHHEVSTEGQLVIQNVNNISLVGDNDNSTTIKCVEQFALAFINITNLSVSKLYFSMCGAPTSWLTSSKMSYSFSSFLVYLVNITNLTAAKLGISHSNGMGLLGINIFGVSSIQQAVFVNNTPNCAILFMDSFSPVETAVLAITDSSFMFGKIRGVEYTYNVFAAGLNIKATQTMYHVKIIIRNVTVHGNTGNMLLKVNCKVAVQGIQVNCTRGLGYGLVLESKQSLNTLKTTTNFNIAIVHSYFGRNFITISLNFDYGSCIYGVKLENITVEEVSRQPHALQVLMNRRSVLTVKDVNFNHNKGAMYLKNTKVEFSGSNIFDKNNCSPYSALSLRQCTATFCGNATFLQNKGRHGGAMYAEDTEINFYGNVMFMENEGVFGGALTLSHNVSVLIGQFADVSFVRNEVSESGGAVYARGSQIIISSGKVSFVENKGYDGGAIALTSSSTLYLQANSSIAFVRNRAYHCGGGIYYVDDFMEDFGPAAELNKCFYGIYMIEKLPATLTDLFNYMFHHTIIEFYNNTADFAGTAIYGGWVDFCQLYITNKTAAFHEFRIYQTSVFDSLFHFHQPIQQLSLISSNPTRLCVCTNMSIPDCSITYYTITAYPGETLTIPAVAVGQRFGTVPTTVYSSFVYFTDVPSENSARLSELQYTQSVNANCTDLTYTIFSIPKTSEVIDLTIEKLNTPKGKALNQALLAPKASWQVQYTENYLFHLMEKQFSQLTVHIEMQQCPLGFKFSNRSQTCICHPKLQQHEINCSIDTQTVYRKSPLWINATFLNETYTQVLVHNHCPFDYCKDGNIQLNMEHPDEQCTLSRSGVLCGSCQQNLSHVLGTSNCKECSSHFLLLILFFIAAGIALVVFLMLLNLTVSVGTINGLIFYANIVRANQAIFFPPDTNNEFLSIFIAWLNLDLGIETCFYSGLDAYAKTWLQFLFPVYIWIIVVLIIVSSHYSTTAAKLSGRNAVQVLATLFLLSYAKLLRITITAFSFTLLEYPDGSVKRIWVYDGNVDYLKGKHIALFVAALLLLVFVSLPYTVALLFIQCLQYRSRYRILSWVRRLKPLFDAYTGPYKDKHRYWPGLLLVVRVALFLVFSVNVFGDPAVSLLTIIVTTFCIFFSTITFGGIFKNILLTLIEYSFFLNLGILSSATLFTTQTDGDQTTMVYTSVGIAFATFIIITIYHILVRVTKKQQRQRFTEWVISKLRTVKFAVKEKKYQNNQNNPIQTAKHNQLIELREPLLESAN